MLAQVAALRACLGIALRIGHQQAGKLHRAVTAFAGVVVHIRRDGGVHDGSVVVGAVRSKSVGQPGFMYGCANRVAQHDGATVGRQKADQSVNAGNAKELA